MKKTVLASVLLTLIYSQAQAITTETSSAPNSAATVVVPAPAPATPAATTAAPAATQPAVIDCNYKIPAETKTIDQSLVVSWSEKATVQAFDLTASTLDNQLSQLKACFTDQGWASFNNALEQSGNIDAIKKQNLTVSSQVDGNSQVIDAGNNQWKISVPLQVVYQNDKEKVTQLLNVNLIIARKPSGDLGIAQIIASARPSAAQTPAATTDTTTAPTGTPASTTTNTTAPATDNTGTTPAPASEPAPATGNTTTTPAPATTPGTTPAPATENGTNPPATNNVEQNTPAKSGN